MNWTPPKGAPMGDYDVSATIGDDTIETGQIFRVDEYRLPTMRASVSGPKQPPGAAEADADRPLCRLSLGRRLVARAGQAAHRL